MNYGKRAALRLNEQRASLEEEHKALLADLAKHPDPPHSADFSERIERLGLALRQAMLDSITISRTLSKHMTALNLASASDAIIANRRLSEVCNEITKTLNQVDKGAARRAGRGVDDVFASKP